MKKNKKLAIERSTVATLLIEVRGGNQANSATSITCGSAIGCGSIITTIPTVDRRTQDVCGITFIHGRCTDGTNPWPPP